MTNIIGKKNWYFLISLLVIIPGLVALLLWGLDLSIDFTGGTRITYAFPDTVDAKTANDIKAIFTSSKIVVNSTQTSGKELFIRTVPITNNQNLLLSTILKQKYGPLLRQEEFESIGPVIGKEITQNAFYSIITASVLIVLYIGISFRKVPKPASAWRFGICAIAALLHDALVLIGLFALLGHFFHIEVDSLFVTAVLTVVGFSVHDTIVVFDRIRENLLRSGSANFPQVVNDSIVQTLSRSLNTSLTAILVLFTLLLFGGASIRWFVVALLIGIISGTYSSIFNAAPLLVLWQEFEAKRRVGKFSSEKK